MKRRAKAVRARTGGPPSVSIVLPIYDEERVIQDLVPRVVQAMRREEIAFEIVAVDDGSRDGSLQGLQQLRKRFPRELRLVRHLVNRGNGASVRTGIRVAAGEIVVTMDADGQHTPEDIPRLLAPMPPYDLVIGARRNLFQGSWRRAAANRFFNLFASWLSRTRIEDLTSGFRAMRRSVALHFLPLFPTGFSAPTTTTLVFLKAGYNVCFVPIEGGKRAAGRSKIRLWEDGSRFVTLILRMIILYDPLRIFLPMGLGLGLLGVLAWIAGLIEAQRLVLPNSAIFLFSAAILVWLLGFISDQITNTRIHYFGDEHVVGLEEERG